MHSAIAAVFILMSALLRFLPHPWNVSPVAGVALFSGALLPKRWAIAVPVLAMAAGDLALGWLPVHLFGWAAVVVSAGLGLWLRNRRTIPAIAGCSIAASTLFFLFSNFGVWLLGCAPGWYPATPAGLAACYAAGVPFYRSALLGDLAYALALFASYEAVTRWVIRIPTPAGE